MYKGTPIIELCKKNNLNSNVHLPISTNRTKTSHFNIEHKKNATTYYVENLGPVLKHA